MNKKAVIISAPSGAGKTTIVKRLLKEMPQLEFSISACSRQKRENEVDGRDYYFFSVEEFREKIANNEFLEWEEVYEGLFYGTLKSELQRIWNKNKIVVFDVDVKGGINLKSIFKQDAISLFIKPPSILELELRLRHRNTESEESLAKRIDKAQFELNFAEKFDFIVVNDILEKALRESKQFIMDFIS